VPQQEATCPNCVFISACGTAGERASRGSRTVVYLCARVGAPIGRGATLGTLQSPSIRLEARAPPFHQEALRTCVTLRKKKVVGVTVHRARPLKVRAILEGGRCGYHRVANVGRRVQATAIAAAAYVSCENAYMGIAACVNPSHHQKRAGLCNET
jgi:hypothetical protein